MAEIINFQGKQYDLEIRGPCCDFFDRKKEDLCTELKIVHRLTGGNPRACTMYLHDEIIKNPLVMIFAESECPCNEVPDPVLYRKFMASILRYKDSHGPKTDPERIKNILINLALEILPPEEIAELD